MGNWKRDLRVQSLGQYFERDWHCGCTLHSNGRGGEADQNHHSCGSNNWGKVHPPQRLFPVGRNSECGGHCCGHGWAGEDIEPASEKVGVAPVCGLWVWNWVCRGDRQLSTQDWRWDFGGPGEDGDVCQHTVYTVAGDIKIELLEEVEDYDGPQDGGWGATFQGPQVRHPWGHSCNTWQCSRGHSRVSGGQAACCHTPGRGECDLIQCQQHEVRGWDWSGQCPSTSRLVEQWGRLQGAVRWGRSLDGLVGAVWDTGGPRAGKGFHGQLNVERCFNYMWKVTGSDSSGTWSISWQFESVW